MSELREDMEALMESGPTVLGEVARLEKELASFKKLAAKGASPEELKKRLNHVRANLENIGMVIQRAAQKQKTAKRRSWREAGIRAALPKDRRAGSKRFDVGGGSDWW